MTTIKFNESNKLFYFRIYDMDFNIIINCVKWE